jgi:hypothetical protein
MQSVDKNPNNTFTDEENKAERNDGRYIISLIYEGDNEEGRATKCQDRQETKIIEIPKRGDFRPFTPALPPMPGRNRGLT